MDYSIFDINSYDKVENSTKEEKKNAWVTGIGLQEVDGLKTSSYLKQLAIDNIEGKINNQQVQNLLDSYYAKLEKKNVVNDNEKQADIVSARISKILQDKGFKFSPVEYMKIHEELFKGILDNAGKFRTYNISKKEWVLDWDTVRYGNFLSLKDNLEYDFKVEKEFSYKNLTKEEYIKHISSFTSNIWQNHIFSEGNTRTTAVFMIKYLNMLGFKINNDLFKDNSFYFRNALVRFNYNNYEKGITATNEYLNKFYENLLFNGNNELKNRHLHINYKENVNEEGMEK